ncbi:hypothetical protein BU16DRAFT_136400 [Lophium mytilinum]|uniref:Uncharacterized protein n=1 Tax=Lophium mytilinum TaxID=390894 RepID=A0A6A6QFI4_9PEZI|nr:hypothetical protein BU16DRAFT_136400 [Lophium mytilinum]
MVTVSRLSCVGALTPITLESPLTHRSGRITPHVSCCPIQKFKSKRGRESSSTNRSSLQRGFFNASLESQGPKVVPALTAGPLGVVPAQFHVLTIISVLLHGNGSTAFGTQASVRGKASHRGGAGSLVLLTDPTYFFHDTVLAYKSQNRGRQLFFSNPSTSAPRSVSVDTRMVTKVRLRPTFGAATS